MSTTESSEQAGVSVTDNYIHDNKTADNHVLQSCNISNVRLCASFGYFLMATDVTAAFWDRRGARRKMCKYATISQPELWK